MKTTDDLSEITRIILATLLIREWGQMKGKRDDRSKTAGTTNRVQYPVHKQSRRLQVTFVK